ncbi:remodeling and spacing factor 1 [Sitophilus oryzae]|uniref:Remodeling and spacing factor 1 n=1 Tax=Sitophilus oryzae TaxID=7048 RepID=A0A6J2YC15_SITOR|nr:remodeling and spacing factor 1 [Sitophilus oryzae]XP_030760460.1 remodeling and spacing factor 1 [Sitophilus oryzae]
MASESEASCEEDPNFAVICAFLEKFGETMGITNVDFFELQSMLENTHEVSKSLVDLHIKLIRKIKKSFQIEKWEKALIKCCHLFSSVEAWEIERFGYKKAKLSSKVRILKELLEMQFDYNAKFKAEVNKLSSQELRSEPIGKDKLGYSYWFHSDNNCQIRVYKEDLDDEKWTLVARDREGLVSLINTLSDGDIKNSSDSAANEDSNSLSDKPLIDTGQVDTDSKKTSEDEDSNLQKKQDEDDKESLKRPREESEEIYHKYKIRNLDVVVSNIAVKSEENNEEESELEETSAKDAKNSKLSNKVEDKEPIVGEAIEEPVMKIQGEGSGAENDSPILSEAIEEDIMYFFGTGSGQECQGGNEPNPEESKEDTKTDEQTALSTEHQNDNNESVGSSKVDKVLDSNLTSKNDVKSEDIVKNDLSSINSVDAKEKVIESNSSGNSLDIKEDSKTKDKSKNDIFKTPLDTKKEVSENEEKDRNLLPKTPSGKLENDIENEKCESKEKDEAKTLSENLDEKLNGKESLAENKLDNNTNNEEKVSDKVDEKTDTKDQSKPVQHENHSEEEKTNKQTDVNTNQITNDSESKDAIKNDVEEQKAPVIEPVCVKKVAYVCGNEESKETNGEVSSKTEENTDKKEPELKSEVTKLVDKDEEKVVKSNCEKSNGVEEKKDLKDVDDKNELKEESKKSEEDKPAIEPELVLVSSKAKASTAKLRNARKKVVRPVRKVVSKRVTRQNQKEEQDSGDENTSLKSGGDSTVISCDLNTEDSRDTAPAVEADPLAVSEQEGESNETTSTPAVKQTLASFSLDFKDSDTPSPAPVKTPSPMRAVRKRGREIPIQKQQEPDNGPEKRMKLKGRRQVDTALRKSVEQRIEQLQASSSESKDSDDEPPAPKPTRRKQKKKSSTPKKPINRNPEKKNSRILACLDKVEDSPSEGGLGLRQSRRIAQMKIKEQVQPQPREERTKKPKEVESTKSKKPVKPVVEVEEVVEAKKKRKKDKPVSRIFNENRPWQSSSDDSDEVIEEDEESPIEEEEEAVRLEDLKSDHEFSPESDLEDADDSQPLKRARTAKKDSDQEETVDDFPCQKCGKFDHPEWILLCDKCDNGWHCSCLRPPLLVIPEGDWFCPPCQHICLLDKLQAKLAEHDRLLSKKIIEDRRKERLAYVGISLNNVLPAKEPSEHRKKKRRHSAEEDSDSSKGESNSDYDSDSDSDDSDEPIYQLRQRRQAKSYKFNEYDEMMKTAIGEELDKPEDTAGNLGRGKDIQTIVKGLEPEPKARENEGRANITNLRKMLRKKQRKLNSLDFDSEEEDISDEDFKGSSSESEEEEDEDESGGSEDSDDYVGKKRRKNLPTRRSTRARTKRYDEDFINDNSDDDAPKRKKKKSIWDESDTEESDASGWGRSRKGKKKKSSGKDKKKSRRIKYGGLTSSEEELGRGRRTRGKRATYVDTLGSDSEEEEVTKKHPRRIDSDDDEDFVANEEEDEVEDEDKGSEENEDNEEEAEEDEDSERERREKRSLLVPKIYIKKPLGVLKAKEPEVKGVANDKAASIPTKPVKPKLEENDNPVVYIEKVNLKAAESKQKINIVIDEDSSSTVEKDITPVTPTKPVKDNVEKPAVELISLSDNKATSIPVVLGKRGRDLKEPLEKHEPIVSNVSALIKNADENDDLSEPPGISLPFFDDMSTSGSSKGKDGSEEEVPKKRRGSVQIKTGEVTITVAKKQPVKATMSDSPKIEIAAPPQPFSQAQPTPSIITRMLQSKPGQATVYPVGSIRPKQFATMRDDDSSDESPKNSRDSSPARTAPMNTSHVPYNMQGGLRGPMSGSYRPQAPHHIGVNHYPRGLPPRGPPNTHIPRNTHAAPPHISHSPSHSRLPLSHGPRTLHGPPNRHVLPPQSGGPPQSQSPHGLPPQTRAPPPQSRVPPPQSRAPPAQTRAPPSQTHAPPSQTHAPPPQTHASPPTHAHPSANSYQHHRAMDPSPSGGGPINLADPEPAGPPPVRYPPVTQPPPGMARPPIHMPPHQAPYPPPPSNSSSSEEQSLTQPPPAEGYYGNYPPAPPPTEDALPPAPYEGIPPEGDSTYPNQYGGEEPPTENPPSDNSNSKPYDDESGGEFAGLASYFSSQREDDLDS